MHGRSAGKKRAREDTGKQVPGTGRTAKRSRANPETTPPSQSATIEDDGKAMTAQRVEAMLRDLAAERAKPRGQKQAKPTAIAKRYPGPFESTKTWMSGPSLDMTKGSQSLGLGIRPDQAPCEMPAARRSWESDGSCEHAPIEPVPAPASRAPSVMPFARTGFPTS